MPSIKGDKDLDIALLKSRLETIDETMDKRFDGVEKRFDNIETYLKDLAEQKTDVALIKDKVTTHETRLNKHAEDIGYLKQISGLINRMDDAEKDIKWLKKFIYIFVGGWTVLITLISFAISFFK